MNIDHEVVWHTHQNEAVEDSKCRQVVRIRLVTVSRRLHDDYGQDVAGDPDQYDEWGSDLKQPPPPRLQSNCFTVITCTRLYQLSLSKMYVVDRLIIYIYISALQIWIINLFFNFYRSSLHRTPTRVKKKNLDLKMLPCKSDKGICFMDPFDCKCWIIYI